MIHYCKKCVMPDTKPDLHLDEEMVCNACRSYESRDEVDWNVRHRELLVHAGRLLGPGDLGGLLLLLALPRHRLRHGGRASG